MRRAQMKQILKELTPPLLVKAIKSRRSAPAPLFASYADALNSCGAEGYQASDVVKVVVEKNAIYRDEIFSSRVIGLDSLRTMVGIGALQSLPTLRVLDFGGGGGSHYSIVRAVLGADRDIRWNVVETTAMAKAAGERLAGGGLKFFDDIRKAATDLGHVDLVFTSGALQYTSDPLAFLSSLLAVRADHMFITRTALHDGVDQVVSAQTSWLSSNGPGPLPHGFKNHEIRYPVTFASRPKALKMIEEAYTVRFAIDEDRAAYTVRGQSFNMYGYFCDLKFRG
ncbi:MAG: hypothetical protein DI561_05345 [Thauera sp.]|nr:MAG: hypothetical protein DI561_05345 [Thauera sp.]